MSTSLALVFFVVRGCSPITQKALASNLKGMFYRFIWKAKSLLVSIVSGCLGYPPVCCKQPTAAPDEANSQCP